MAEPNIRGPSGIINRTGTPGSSATLVDCHADGFWSNIEDGILSTVRILVAHGYYTVSSCEGHPDSYSARTVSVLGSADTIDGLLDVICKINRNSHRKPILYVRHPRDLKMRLYQEERFVDPSVLDIFFGDFRDKATFDNQADFDSSVPDADSGRTACHRDAVIVDEYRFANGHLDTYQ